MSAKVVLGGMLFVALALAGCTGSFQVKQTEPIRIQLDGESEETRIAASGAEGGGDAEEKREFVIDSDEDVEVVQVSVQVTKVVVEDDGDGGDEPCVINVIVEDRDSKEKLGERRVEANESAAQVNLDVDVKGHDNIVIVTQAVQGVADVEVAAQEAEQSGNTTQSSP